MKVVEEVDGALLTHEFDEMSPQKRPQDPDRDGRGFALRPSSTAASTPI
jgi:hypothetical protein